MSILTCYGALQIVVLLLLLLLLLLSLHQSATEMPGLRDKKRLQCLNECSHRPKLLSRGQANWLQCCQTYIHN